MAVSYLSPLSILQVRANCLATDAVGDAVYITGPAIGGLYQVAKADPSDPNKMPAIGVIISKSSPTVCKLQTGGEVKNIYSGFTPGDVLFVGASGPPSHTAGVTSQVIGVATSTDVAIIYPEYETSPDSLIFGADSVGSTTTTRYLYAGYAEGLAEIDPHYWTMVRSGTIRKLYVRHDDPAGNGNPIVYRVRVNTVASLLVVTLASTASVGSNLTQAVPVLAGDVVDVQIVKTSGVGSPPRNVKAVMEIS